ncbi:MAG: hypothetical protein IJ269_02610 [Bacteroidales bacterium]|nr:hypothetical protein [Bacteroidales bacterium]
MRIKPESGGGNSPSRVKKHSHSGGNFGPIGSRKSSRHRVDEHLWVAPGLQHDMVKTFDPMPHFPPQRYN